MSFSSHVKEELSRQVSPAQTLPDSGDSGYSEPVREGSYYGGQQLHHTDPYGKCGCCKKILYFTEKSI